MVKIEIDGKEIEAQQGETVIQAADREDIYIPRFCYHKKLSVAANCRMCLVEVEKVPKALPACATPVAEGMKVFTKSEKAIDAQKAVMEFLLINHPLDCPICDQGGQCELQDLSMGFGGDDSGFVEMKRAVPNPDLGPLIATEMTRCIHCTRCVRFEDEVAGERELGGMFRGEHTEISTYAKHTVKSEISGNVIDICPVGALTSKPFRFQARAWELTQTPGVAPHDCLGSNVHLGTLRGELLRVSPKENESINEVWISDRDRFSYVGSHSKQRALSPMVKVNGQWQTASWQQAFDEALKQVQTVLNASGVESFGALASPSSTVEELYLLQQFMRGIGSNNIDHRLRQIDFSDQQTAPLHPTLGVSIADLAEQQAILLVGSDVRTEQPIAGVKVRQASLKGAKVFAVNMVDYEFNFAVQQKLISKPSQLVNNLAQIAKALIEQTNKQHAAAEVLKSTTVSAEAKQIAEGLLAGQRATVLFGLQAINHHQAAKLRWLAKLIAELSNATFASFSAGANSQGAWLAGCVPHRLAAGKSVEVEGLTAYQMLQQKLKAYLLLNIEPELDCANSSQALTALKAAECVVALTPFVTETIKEYATVILPIATWGETSGTFVNITGEWQQFTGVVAPKGEARPAWKVLRVLGNVFKLEGFEYTSSEEVLAEVRELCRATDFSAAASEAQAVTDKPVELQQRQLERIGNVPMYRIDNLVRQAEPLQAMLPVQGVAGMQINSETAASLGVKADQKVSVRQTGQQRLLVVINEAVPTGCALIAAGLTDAVGLGDNYGVVEITE